MSRTVQRLLTIITWEDTS